MKSTVPTICCWGCQCRNCMIMMCRRLSPLFETRALALCNVHRQVWQFHWSSWYYWQVKIDFITRSGMLSFEPNPKLTSLLPKIYMAVSNHHKLNRQKKSMIFISIFQAGSFSWTPSWVVVTSLNMRTTLLSRGELLRSPSNFETDVLRRPRGIKRQL
jgi:hypothetical protein